MTARYTSPTTVNVTFHGNAVVKDVQTIPQSDNVISELRPGQTETLTGVPPGTRVVKYWTHGGALEQVSIEPLLH